MTLKRNDDDPDLLPPGVDPAKMKIGIRKLSMRNEATARSVMTVRGHTVITDETGDGDTGPTPLETTLSALAGALIRPLEGLRGVYTADQAEAAVRGNSRYEPTTSMIAVEQTSNFGGGTVWPLETVRAIAEVARRHELALHMDGARLMNACVASGISAADYAAPFDSLWIDLSKGLGCPIGGVLAGSGDFIAQAWRWKQRIGGAMRQAGIIAAAGVYALENNVERLAEDHANARLFADRLADVPGIAVEPDAVETNIVFFDVGGTGLTADQVAERLADHGVRIGPMGEDLMRAVTHLDVTTEQVAKAAAAVRAVVEAA